MLEDQEAVDLVLRHVGGAGPPGAGAAGVGGAAGGGGGGGGAAPGGGLPTSKAKTAAQVLVDASLAKGSSDNVTAVRSGPRAFLRARARARAQARARTRTNLTTRAAPTQLVIFL